MNKPIHKFFTDDHRNIEAILETAIANSKGINMELYHRFRTKLLKHIKMEEKILFPAAQKASGDVTLTVMAKLRLEHGAITALMVPPPTMELIKVLKYILDKHDFIEEAPGGMYDVCESLTHHQTEELLIQLKNTPEVPVQGHNEALYALEAAKRSCARAGYDYDAIASAS